MRVIVAGSRHETDPEKVARAIGDSGFNITCLFSGCCQGVDLMAEVWAKENSIFVVRFPADWRGLGKRGGPERNQRMVDNADALIAIPGPESKGTWDIINRAQAKGLPIYIYSEVKA
jgi:predicted Rossmann-fold nucleotide-binding protein